tara:strand:- start:1154 stop:2200 length:1047 start_codon:yes stop_codon:yes gene_type:complete
MINSIGILGGGQLGMFLCEAGKKQKKEIYIFSESPEFSSKRFCKGWSVGELNNLNKINEFINKVDIVTIETENIPLPTLKFIESKKKLLPSAHIIEITQNRVKEKYFLNSLKNIKTTDFLKINSFDDLLATQKIFGNEFIIKSCEFGYDGKNQFKINQENIKSFQKKNLKHFIAEKIVDFELEISVIVCRDIFGKVISYPPVENTHINGILSTSKYPAKIKTSIIKNSISISEQIAESFDLIGIIAVEMFVLKNDTILINELAPRPHNSGHWSLDSCKFNQFDNLINSISKQSVCHPNIFVKSAVMKNIIGSEYLNKEKIMKSSKFYDYFKKDIKAKRKMAHYTITED